MSLHIQSLPPRDLEFQMFVMDELADAALERGRDVIKLTIGVTDLPAPKKVRRMIADTVDDPVTVRRVFPQGLPELRAAIAKYYNEQFHAGVDAEHVIVNAGTSPIFRNLFQLLSTPGQEILIPRPYYCLYKICALLARAKVTYYDIDLDTRKVDLRSFRRAYSPERTAVVVINNPGNPVGNVLSEGDVRAIYEVIGDRSYVVNDEIYNNCSFYTKLTTPLSYLPESSRRVTIVTNSFSKGFRLYTKRVGYALLPDELVMPMRIVQQHTLLTHDPVTQLAAVEALNDLESPAELCRIYRDRAEYSFDRLQGAGCQPIRADGGFYVVLDCGDWIRSGMAPDSIALARDILAKVNVATVPGTDFGAPDTLRLSLCNARFNEGMDRLYDYFTRDDVAGRRAARRTGVAVGV